MTQTTTECIVLSRTNYGEADRILTVLTRDKGKVRLIAKGVRKSKSKLAGGIELFSVSYITYIEGRGEINTLISTRLKDNYGNIVKNVDRTMFGYELLKLSNRITEDAAGSEYFDILLSCLKSLDDPKISLELIRFWFYTQLLKYGGHSPNLKTDSRKQPLKEGDKYNFSFDDMAFSIAKRGRYNSQHIKLLRLSAGVNSTTKLDAVQGIGKVLDDCQQLVKTMLSAYVRL